MCQIKFGTDGWRAEIAQDFTFANVQVVAQAIAEYLIEEQAQAPQVIVTYDTRFLSDQFARTVAQVLTENGIDVLLTKGPAPSPVASFMIVKHRLAGAVVITASHNPAQWNGIKIRDQSGGAAPVEITARIGERANQLLAGAEGLPKSKAPGTLTEIDPHEEYLASVESQVDQELIRKARLRVLVDAMHGASIGYLDRALAEVGCQVKLVRGEDNPGFGGVQPEPIEENLKATLPLTRDPEVDVGFASDGDGDRLAVMAEGQYLDVHRMLSLLLIHLVKNRAMRGAVVRTVSTTSMLDKLAEKYGLPLVKTKVGFKYIGQVIESQEVLLGVEESSGVAVKGHIPERDGTLAALLFSELMAREGKSVPELVEMLWQEVGGPHYFHRSNLRISPQAKEQLIGSLDDLDPEQIAGQKVTTIDRRDGIKFFLPDGSWLLLRVSGTEPLVRVYVESQSQRLLDDLIQAGEKMVGQFG